jgi:hypothetical protein
VTTPPTPCPCPRPEGLSDEAVREVLAQTAIRPRPFPVHTFAADRRPFVWPRHGDPFPAQLRDLSEDPPWHVVEWRRCGAEVLYGGWLRCDLRHGHAGDHLGRNATVQWMDNPPGYRSRWLHPPGSEPAWPVPCWTRTAAEAERWRGEGETAATSAPICICNPGERCSECSPELRGSDIWGALSANLREMEAAAERVRGAACSDFCEGPHEDGGAVPSCSFVAGHRGMCLCPGCADEYSGESGEALREQALAEEEAARAARAPGGGVQLAQPGDEPLVLRTMGDVEDAVREGVLRQTGPSHYEVLGRELRRSYVEGSNPFATPHPPGAGGEGFADLDDYHQRAGTMTPAEIRAAWRQSIPAPLRPGPPPARLDQGGSLFVAGRQPSTGEPAALGVIPARLDQGGPPGRGGCRFTCIGWNCQGACDYQHEHDSSDPLSHHCVVHAAHFQARRVECRRCGRWTNHRWYWMCDACFRAETPAPSQAAGREPVCRDPESCGIGGYQCGCRNGTGPGLGEWVRSVADAAGGREAVRARIRERIAERRARQAVADLAGYDEATRLSRQIEAIAGVVPGSVRVRFPEGEPQPIHRQVLRVTIALGGPSPPPKPAPKPATLFDAASAWLARRHARWLAAEAQRVAGIRARESLTAAGGTVATVNRALVGGTLQLGAGGLPVGED